MGAFNGTINARAYRTLGLPDDWDAAVAELNRSRFKELDPASGRDKSFGWVLAENPFSTEITKEAIFYGNNLVLALRLDTVSVAPAQVKFHLERLVREKLKKEGREHLAKKERQDLAEELMFDLRRRALPQIRLAELVWDTDSHRLWYFSRSPALVDPFEELFKECFGVLLLHESPYTVANSLLGQEKADTMLEWERGMLVDPED
jgi:DNA recombination-dependent growth factor C